ncbi:MAG: IS66 family insertion sequence element accessory protein TnpB [Bacteroidales bacterium]|nr:IS66 family insertion sequence element accessory protein TnpB [Bacteroidales bacterium]
MFNLTSSLQYYLYRGDTDMRKSFDGLCGIVQNQLYRNPIPGEVFIFINRRRDKIKLLHWDAKIIRLPVRMKEPNGQL